MLLVLYTFICLLVAFAIFAGAFYMSRYVVRLETRTAALEDEITRATDHIKQMEEHALQLQQEIEYLQKTAQARSERIEGPRNWQPGNPLSSAERM